MLTVLGFAPLLIAVFLMQLGVGALGPLDALSGVAHGFSAREIGLLGSAHFVGFVVGCLSAPALLAQAGHARSFAVAATIGVIGALLHPLVVEPIAWMAMRVAAGFAVAVSYTVIESWLQAKLTNENRGRALSGYRMIDMTGAVGSQLLLVQLEPALYASYTIIAIIAMLSLMPLALTGAAPPEAPKRPRLRPVKALLLSPLGAVGVFVVGVTNSSFRMVGPIYGVEFAFTLDEIAFFLAAAMLGGALAQPLVGWLADKLDRRGVLIGISAAALAACGALASGAFPPTALALTVGAFLFGAAAMPLYSVSSAYANDHCPRDFIVELNASLILFFALGAILGPVVAAELLTIYGPNALWAYIAAAHAGLILFGLYRMARRPAPERRGAYGHVPRTSLILGRLLKRSDRAAPDQDGAEAPPGAASGH